LRLRNSVLVATFLILAGCLRRPAETSVFIDPQFAVLVQVWQAIQGERTRQQHAPRFAGGHLVQPPLRQVRDTHPGQRVRRARPHLRRHRAIPEDALRRQESGEHGRLRVDAPLVVAEHEAMVQVGRDNPELRTQLEDIPAGVTEHADRGRPVLVTHGPVVMREEVDQRRFAGAVRPKDGGVLALVDREREAVEDAPIVLDDRRVEKL